MRHRLVRFLFVNALVGAGVAVGFIAAMLVADIGRLRTLVWANDAGLLALAVMTAFFVITFGSVQMGIALMLRGEEGGPRTRRFVFAPVRPPRVLPWRAAAIEAGQAGGRSSARAGSQADENATSRRARSHLAAR